MGPLVVTDITLALIAAAVLVYHLIRVIQLLRAITSKLANARILLLTTASQTEPATEVVSAVGNNVSALHDLVTGVARSLGLRLEGAR